MAIGIDEEAVKNWKVRARLCVIMVHDICTFLDSAFSILIFCLAEFDTSAICHMVFGSRLISIARYALKVSSIGFRGTKCEIFWERV